MIPSGRRGSLWAWGRSVGSAVTVTVLVWHFGAGPFLDGVRTVDGRAFWRRRPSSRCSPPSALRGDGRSSPAASVSGSRCRPPWPRYYRSVFLNVTLPGGIVGDVHRGISHGRDVSDVGRGLRAVAWERFAGQVVQAVLTVAVLLVLPSPVRSSMPLVAIAVVVAVSASCS